MDWQIIGISVGSALVGMLAPKLAAMFRKAGPGAEALLQGAVDKADNAAFTRWGFRLPMGWHAEIDAAIKAGIAWAEGVWGSEDFEKEFLFVLRGNSAKIPERLLTLLSEWALKGMPKVDIPPEAVALVNEAKENLATKAISASLAATLPAEVRPTETQIREDIRSVAPAAGRLIPATVATANGTQRPEWVQQEIEKLREKAAK